MTPDQKIDRILELLEKQEQRAKWAIFWKLFWIFILVILPIYLSYKLMSSFDFSSFTGLMDMTGSATKNSPSADELNTLLDMLNNR